MAPSTVKCYISAISFYNKINNYEDMSQLFVVRKMIDGMARSKLKRPDSQEVSVWIVGSSLIRNAFVHARSRTGGVNLGLHRIGVKIWWQGYGGMGIKDLESTIKRLMKYEKAPKYLVLHIAGNDLGKTKLGFLRNEIKTTLEKSQPYTTFLFGDDVSKVVKDIEDCSKIANRIHFGRGSSRSRGRFGRGGRGRFGRGRGRGRGIGRDFYESHSRQDFASTSNDSGANNYPRRGGSRGFRKILLHGFLCTENKDGKGQGNTDSTSLDNATLAYQVSGIVNRQSLNNSKIQKIVNNSSSRQLEGPSTSENASSDCMSCVRKLYRKRGLSKQTVNIIMSSWKLETEGLLKQSRPWYRNPQVHLKAYLPDRRLCVYTVLKEYLYRTKQLRQKNSKLLISYVKPHEDVIKDTIARWVKTVLRRSGIDTKIYGAHSMRSATTSPAKFKAVPIQEILDKAGWTNERTFSKFYN
ncbi:unnamed protein product [Mytilus edulis]|uniref:Tyr recombinase domain-containing protein n=1 Tax=Mytilus edulis TaxID=6550 RepID=A0A8S3TKE8_MYTED|nr:unnamed protein product [Mytilus edulis]